MSGPTRRELRSRPPERVHWVVLGAVLISVLVALLTQGYTHRLSSIADEAPPASGSASDVPDAVLTGGPVIDARGEEPRTAGPAPRTVALTFDDGPDPEWTPRILDVLREHGAHATFFAVGTAVIDHPDLARRIVAEGHELGVHTLTHVDLSTAPDWRRDLEIDAAQLAIIEATGKATALLRPPYSATSEALTDDAWSAIRTAGEDGYLTVLSTADTRDWRGPDPERIERAIVEGAATGQVVLMHDAGGDREATIAALDRALTQLEAQGHRAVSVGESVGLRAVMHEASAADRVEAAAAVWGIRLSDVVVTTITWLLVISGGLTIARAVMVVAAAARHRRAAERRRSAPARAAVLDPVTVIVPAYNEAAGIQAAVRSIAASEHDVEVIVVDDGSSDGTAELVEALALPRVHVVRRPNGGKPAALNTGIRAASHDLIVMVDGDTVFEPGTVRALIQPFADPQVGAVSGNTKIINRGGVLGAWQHIEYVVGFNLDRRLFDLAECMPTVPGAIGAFRRDTLRRLGGVSEDTLAEDTDLTMAVCRDGWRVVYQDDAVAWTEAPATLDALWRQRYRWCYGTMQAMWKHRAALVQGGPAGKLGRRGIGYLLLFQVLLPMLAPVVDVFAVYGLLFLDPLPVVAVWAGFLLVQVVMAAYAFRLDGERLSPLWALPLQQVVYRQLMYLVVFQSAFTALAGVRLRWQRMERYGTLRAPAEPLESRPAQPTRRADAR